MRTHRPVRPEPTLHEYESGFLIAEFPECGAAHRRAHADFTVTHLLPQPSFASFDAVLRA
jgi:hypothetical protein